MEACGTATFKMPRRGLVLLLTAAAVAQAEGSTAATRERLVGGARKTLQEEDDSAVDPGMVQCPCLGEPLPLPTFQRGTATSTPEEGSASNSTLLECLPVRFNNEGSGQVHCYPPDYGSTCNAWDRGE